MVKGTAEEVGEWIDNLRIFDFITNKTYFYFDLLF